MHFKCENCGATYYGAASQCNLCGSHRIVRDVQYRDAQGRKLQFGDGTQAERSERMIRSYTVDSVGDTDTVVTLEQSGGSVRLDGSKTPVWSLKVAHISSCGWVDIFNGYIDRDEYPENDRSEHMCIRPSELEILQNALQERERQTVRDALDKLDGELSAHVPSGLGYRSRMAMETVRDALGMLERPDYSPEPLGIRASDV